MTAYYDVKLRGLWIQVEGLAIVQHVDIHFSRFGNGGFRERFRPFRCIHVATHRHQRGNVGEGFQNARVAHVAGMNDQI